MKFPRSDQDQANCSWDIGVRILIVFDLVSFTREHHKPFKIPHNPEAGIQYFCFNVKGQSS